MFSSTASAPALPPPLPQPAADVEGEDDLAMLDCFDPDDPEMSEFLGGEFSDAVDIVALDIPPVDENNAVVPAAATPQEENDTETSTASPEIAPPDAPASVVTPSSAIEPSSDLSSSELSSAEAEWTSAALSDDVSMCSSASSLSSSSRPKRARRNSLTHAPSPPRSRPRQHPHQQGQQRQQVQRSSSVTSSDGNGDPYNHMLNKLAASMKRSEMSRASVMRQRQYSQGQGHSPNTKQNSSMMRCTPPRQMQQRQQQPSRSVPQFQSMVGLSGFLNGQRSTLTSGLEQSRRQLRAYMASANRLQSI